MTTNHPIVLYDGECGLCDRFVQFTLARDSKGVFRFAALQSSIGRDLLEKHGLAEDGLANEEGAAPSTVVVVEGDRAWTRSGAALRVAKRLRMPWPLLYVFVIVPPFLRDAVYRFVAARRYRWFGKVDACRLPSPSTRDRFLDQAAD